MGLIKSNRTFCCVFLYHAMLRGNQHGGHKNDDLQNWLDMASHETLYSSCECNIVIFYILVVLQEMPLCVQISFFFFLDLSILFLSYKANYTSRFLMNSYVGLILT